MVKLGSLQPEKLDYRFQSDEARQCKFMNKKIMAELNIMR